MAKGQVLATANVWLVLRDSKGDVKDIRVLRNLVVNAGLAWLASALSGAQATPSNMKYVAIGTGTATAVAGDTALGGEVETRVAGTQSLTTVDTANDGYLCVGTQNITANRAVTEVGLFSASTSGSLLARQIFSVMNMVSGDSLQTTWRIDFDAA